MQPNEHYHRRHFWQIDERTIGWLLFILGVLPVILAAICVVYISVTEYTAFVHGSMIYSRVKHLSEWLRPQIERGDPLPSDLTALGELTLQPQSWRTRYARDSIDPKNCPRNAVIFRTILKNLDTDESAADQPGHSSQCIYVYIESLDIPWDEPADILVEEGKAWLIRRDGKQPVELRGSCILRRTFEAPLIPKAITDAELMRFLQSNREL